MNTLLKNRSIRSVIFLIATFFSLSSYAEDGAANVCIQKSGSKTEFQILKNKVRLSNEDPPLVKRMNRIKPDAEERLVITNWKNNVIECLISEDALKNSSFRKEYLDLVMSIDNLSKGKSTYGSFEGSKKVILSKLNRVPLDYSSKTASIPSAPLVMDESEYRSMQIMDFISNKLQNYSCNSYGCSNRR
jgi:hypothetical protein